MALRRHGRRLAAVVAAGLFTGACIPNSTPSTQRAAAVTPSWGVSFSAPQASDCQASSPQPGPPAEVKGSNLWALVFAPLPIKAGIETKIVWRMGGRGVFNIGSKTIDGAIAQLTFGPEPHLSSSWNIPKTDEWGTGFVFPKAGCWRVHAWRGGTNGDVYFLVVQA
jgi:hypothetical protein